MAINIVDNFHLGSARSLDDRYVVNTIYDVSMYWHAGMQVFQLADQLLYNYDGSVWHAVLTNFDILDGGNDWSVNPNSVSGGSW